MVDNTNKAAGKSGIENEIGRQFGVDNISEEKGTVKTPVMSFSQENVYLGLKLVSYYDEKKGVRKEPVPRITAGFNGKFVEVPMNGKFWRAYADFVAKLADAMEGVNLVNSNIHDDVETAKGMMAKYRTAAE